MTSEFLKSLEAIITISVNCYIFLASWNEYKIVVHYQLDDLVIFKINFKIIKKNIFAIKLFKITIIKVISWTNNYMFVNWLNTM